MRLAVRITKILIFSLCLFLLLSQGWARQYSLTILHTNDMHASFVPR